MEDIRKKDNQRALIGTAIFHAFLLVSFFFFGLSTPLPLPEEEGVLVTLGYLDMGTGDVQPLSATPPTPDSRPSVPASPAEQVVTQDTEESVRLPSETTAPPAERTRPESPRTETATPPVETAPERPVEEPAREVDPRAIFPGSDQRSTERQQQGETGDPGSQGRPEGSITGEGYIGFGQGGIEYSLAGRRHTSVPIPDYNIAAEGRVVVAITVNRQGQVVRAAPGARGTTTSNQALWNLARDAALRARFDVNMNAALEQQGTITYNFIRQN
jgi:colicin import membrane protein